METHPSAGASWTCRPSLFLRFALPLVALSIFSIPQYPHQLSFAPARASGRLPARIIARRSVGPHGGLWRKLGPEGLTQVRAMGWGRGDDGQYVAKQAAWVRALELYGSMQKAGVQPDTRTYNDLMTICLRCGQLDRARDLFDTMLQQNVTPDARSLGAMAGVYGKSADWENALDLLQEAKRYEITPNVILYTNIISACAKQGEWKPALRILDEMKLTGTTPSRITYNAAVHSCCKAREMDIAEGLVSEMKTSVGVDVVTYTSLIAGHMWNQDIRSVIDTFKSMQEDNIAPNGQTYSSVLTAFTRAGLWRSALDAYQTLLEQRITAPTAVHNLALQSYLKLGEWLNAVRSYLAMKNNRIPQDGVSHCLAIQAHFGGGQYKAGFAFLKQIEEGLHDPGLLVKIYETALNGCQRAGLWQKAISIIQNRLALDQTTQGSSYVSVRMINAAIGTCAKTRKMNHAFNMYELMKERSIQPNGGTYAGLMAATAQAPNAYTKYRQNRAQSWQLALAIEEEMTSNDIPLDAVTFTAFLTALARAGQWQRAQTVYEKMVDREVVPNDVTHSALITAYGNGGQWKRALEAFQKCNEVNEVAVSCLVSAMGKCGKWERVIKILQQLETTLGHAASITTYNAVISALGKCKQIERADGIYNTIVSQSANNSLSQKSLNATVETLGEGGGFRRGEGGGKILAPNVVTFGAMIEACESKGDWERALEVFSDMEDRGHRANTPLTHRMLSLLYSNRRWTDAVGVFERLLAQGVQMDRYKYTSAIAACVRSKDKYMVSVKAHSIFRDMINKQISPGVVAYGAIIHACAKEKNLQRALVLFEEMQRNHGLQPDVAIYTSLIKATAHQGDWERAIEFFKELEHLNEEDPSQLGPNVFTYNALITTLTNCRQSDRAMDYYEDMKSKVISPDKVTYDRLIQGYEVRGEWEVIMKIMSEMNENPTAITYQRAISACQVKNDWKQAIKFYEEMTERGVHPRENTYLALYDICLEANLPEAASEFYNYLRQSTEDMDKATVPFLEVDEEDDFDDPEPLESEPVYEDYDATN